MATPPLPPGFTLDQPDAATPPLPPGFTPDQQPQTRDQKVAAMQKADRIANDPTQSGYDNGPWGRQGNANLDTLVAGLGQHLVQAGNGIRQMMTPSQVYDPESGTTIDNSQARKQLDAEIAEHRQLDKPLDANAWGVGGNIAGAAATTAAVPGGWLGSAASGGALGLTTPVLGNESRGENTALGVGAGLIGQGAGAVMGRIIRPIGNHLVGLRDQAVAVLRNAGVNLDAAQQTGSKFLITAKNAAADNPLLSKTGYTDTQASEYTQAALKEVGVNSTDASQPVMDKAMRAIKSTYNDVATRYMIPLAPTNYSDPLAASLRQIRNSATNNLEPGARQVIHNQIKNIFEAVGGEGPKAGGTITGERFQNIMDNLDKISGENGKAPYVEEIRQALTAALSRSASPADRALLAQADQRYGAWKQIARAIDADKVRPDLLYNAMDTTGREGQSVRGLGPNQRLFQLAEAGRLLLGRMAQTPNSGSGQRLAGMTLFGSAGVAADYKARGAPGGMEPWLVGVVSSVGGPALLRTAIENPKVADGIRKWAASQGVKDAASAMKWIGARAGTGAAANGMLPQSPPPLQNNQ